MHERNPSSLTVLSGEMKEGTLHTCLAEDPDAVRGRHSGDQQAC
ncbi:hypothetical protein [Marinobacter vulgaris]|nr:hypothetical protein [Marinobacter vulgaris]